MTEKKYIYLFEEGNKSMREILGGKGANLAEMTRIGLPVPPGFTITTAACCDYYAAGQKFSALLEGQIEESVGKLEKSLQKKFGDANNPLLVSVRSGSVFSMPGMMDTVLNLGLNDVTVEGLARISGNRSFALDCYRRFLQMFGSVVFNIEHYYFEEVLANQKEIKGIKSDADLTEKDLTVIISKFKETISRWAGKTFPQEPQEQLILAIKAVFDSWNNQRAVVYRRLHKIPDDLGTAVNIQAMVFGNLGEDCGTGVAFTRNPSTGEKELYGEFLLNAQGEDVVAGTRTPIPIDQMADQLPSAYQEFIDLCSILEKHYHDMQDIEFTIERGRLFLLQTRTGKRTAQAEVRIAVEMVEEGVLSREEALLRIEPSQIDQLLHSQIDPTASLMVIAKGLSASPGAASGKIVFDADKAEQLAEIGEEVLLVRPETTPDDIHGMVAAKGILTSRGGMTSHAAVVARGMGKPCVSGCEEVQIDITAGRLEIGDYIFQEGDMLSIDGSTGRIIKGEVPLIMPELSSEFKKLLSWADNIRCLKVRANADTPEDARKAREFGAEGIGLCRTEHMFMAVDRLPVVREMILADTLETREQALKQLLPMQQGDFKEIFKAMAGLPVTIRLLDPPLHEFLPSLEELVVERVELKHAGAAAKELYDKDKLIRQVRNLAELNPMLGHRGCRLGVVFPEIYRMQIEAIFYAAGELLREGSEASPEIMIPLVGHAKELATMRELVEETARKISREIGVEFNYLVGTMIELPRACVTAGEIARYADFFSFGTNDLTQTTLGYSRDDAEGKFMHCYLQKKILPENPFAVLDREGVGSLVKIAMEKGRLEKTALKLGICGEHGGEPNSIEFCHQIELDYVSCSPFRVPIARLAAAQATLK